MGMNESVAIDVVKAMMNKASDEEREALRIILNKAGIEMR